jgi:CheY-like chemotaxis protein
MSRRILIIDDSPTLRKVLSYLLKKKNIDTDLAQNGREGLQKLETESYDLIILDMNMPVMGGMEVLNHLKQKRDFQIPILILTANNEVRDQGLALGASYFLTKPFRPRSILDSIAEIFGE